jgi:(p)ppGpp synthase/HD superfamily hydrolase
MEKLALASAFAALVHAKHTYDGDPYMESHLADVREIGVWAGMSTEDDLIRYLLHDTIEDIDPLLVDMAKAFIFTNFGNSNFQVIWALSGFGHNRKSRTAHAYAKIARYPEAANYKVIDRIANWEKGITTRNTGKASMYAKEDETFRENVVRFATNSKLVDRYNGLRARYDTMMEEVRAAA